MSTKEKPDISQLMKPTVEVLVQPPQLNERTIGGLQIQKVGDQPRKFMKILVYGDPGVGKTRLAGSAADVEDMSPVLLLDIDGGDMSLVRHNPDVDVVRVTTWEDMQRLYVDLRKGDFPYKTFVVDSLTELQKFGMLQIMAEAHKADPDRDIDKPQFAEWGKNGEQTRRVVRLFRDLPVHVVLTAHVIYDKTKEGRITGRRPDLSGKLSRQVAGFIDTVGYYYVKVVEGKPTRLLLTQGNEETIAKDRSDRLDAIVQNPTMKLIHDAYFG